MNLPSDRPFRRIGLVGFGLMGGSLARSLKTLSVPPFIRATASDPDDLGSGLEAGVLDETLPIGPGFLAGLDLVVLATPLDAALDLLPQLPGNLGAEAVVTDVVSLKNPLTDKARDVGLGSRFVGSHPMAGGEGTGFQASRVGLFEGVRVWVTPNGADHDAVERVERFWRVLGARPAKVGAAEHDTMMAWVSHLPQLLSNSLALALENAGFQREALGTGGRDMTRLAGSAPQMWESLLRSAPPDLLSALGAVEEGLAELRELLERGDVTGIARMMGRTRRWTEGGEWS